MSRLKDSWNETKQGYDCWCGNTHTGSYAIEDWIHHHCLHPHLIVLREIDSDGTFDIICGSCGETFNVEPNLFKSKKE